MLDISNCTAICIDTENHALAAQAARRCAALCNFSEIFILSNRSVGFDTKLIRHISSVEDYSAFVAKELVEFVETEFVLIFQWDGFVLNSSAWDAHFLSYDYIGAPWPPGSFVGGDVGNGGFSLRTRRLLEITAEAPTSSSPFEDVAIVSEIARRYPIQIAPVHVARKFSYELLPTKIPTFGFHGHFNFFRVMKEEELFAVLDLVPDSFWKADKALTWVNEAWKAGQKDLSKTIYDFCKVNFPDKTLEWPSEEIFFRAVWRLNRFSKLSVPASQEAAPTGISKDEKIAIVVLGMHRSGTSVATELMTKLGATGARHVLAADHHNEAGYWESPEIVALNDVLISKCRSSWDDWRSLNLDSAGIVEVSNFRQSALDIIQNEYGGAELIAVKDPRICRFFPLWRSILEDSGYSTRALMVLRSPAEVAKSLYTRDGISEERANLLWLRYNLDAEFNSRNLERSYICYDDLFQNLPHLTARVGQELDISWPTMDAIHSQSESELVRHELRHHHETLAISEASSRSLRLVNRAYYLLLSLIKCPHDASILRMIDEVRADLEAAESLTFAAFSDVQIQLTGQVARAHLITQEYIVHSSALDQHLAEAREQRDRQASVVAELVQHSTALEHDLAEARQQRDEQASSVTELVRHSTMLEHDLAEARCQRDEQASSVAELVQRSTTLERDLAEARQQRSTAIVDTVSRCASNEE